MAERAAIRILRGLLVGATVASAGYQIAALLAARRWRRRSREAERGTSELPPVSILKPIRGTEPHAAASFASFCVQRYPKYELLFGVADPTDPAVDLVRSLATQYPEAQVRWVKTSADLGPNRKVCNLHGLAAAAQYDLLLVSDSDMRVQPDYLHRIAAAFADPAVGLVTCPYRGAEPDGFPAAMEALGIAAGFMPGVFVATLGQAAFAFGSTIALRRETLEQIGGFEALVGYLADDFQMGKRVADLGPRVHLSSVVVDSVLGRRSFRESWSRRLRWARTVRACRPLGHLGSGLTHTTALALLTMVVCLAEQRRGIHHRDTETLRPAEHKERHGIHHGAGEERSDGGRAPGETRGERHNSDFSVGRSLCLCVSVVNRQPEALVALALGMRLLAAWRVAVVELESAAARRWFWLLPVSDLVEAALWGCSLFGQTVLWRGQRYRLLAGGRIARLEGEEDDAREPLAAR